jgi:hypothetical protein
MCLEYFTLKREIQKMQGQDAYFFFLREILGISLSASFMTPVHNLLKKQKMHLVKWII